MRGVRLAAARAGAERAAERQRARLALLDALTELGYDVGEELQTALVRGGRLLVRRPHNPAYAVEVVASSDLAHIQTTLVRFGAPEPPGDLQRRQDVAEETAWCGDHARVRELMRGRGHETRFTMQRAAGAKPVKVIPVEAQSSGRSSTSERAAAPAAGRRAAAEEP